LFQDSDFFVSFASARIFHDPLAAAFLMDTRSTHVEWLHQIRARLHERVSVFHLEDLDRRAREYEEFEKDSELRRQGASAIDLETTDLLHASLDDLRGAPAEDDSALYDLFNASMDLRSEFWDVSTRVETHIRATFMKRPTTVPLEQWLYIHQLGWRHRSMVRLRRLTATAEIEGENVIFRNSAGQIAARCKKVSNTPRITHDAVYTLYLDPTSVCMLRVAQVSNEQSVSLLGVEVEPRSIQIREGQVRLLIDAALAGERHEYNRSKPGGMDQVASVLDAILPESDAHAVMKFAREIALVPVTVTLDDVSEAALVQRLHKYGIFGWLGRERPVAEAAVKMSLLTSAGRSLSAIREEMSSDDLNVDELLGRLDAFATEHGVCLYEKVLRNGREFVVLSF